MDEILEKGIEHKGLFGAFDKWRDEQTPEQMEQFYSNLEKINNDDVEWLKFRARQINKLLEPVYDKAEYDCKLCNNSGQIFEVVLYKDNYYIAPIECECVKKRSKKNDI